MKVENLLAEVNQIGNLEAALSGLPPNVADEYIQALSSGLTPSRALAKAKKIGDAYERFPEKLSDDDLCLPAVCGLADTSPGPEEIADYNLRFGNLARRQGVRGRWIRRAAAAIRRAFPVDSE